jgi:hypothetical protein
MNLIAKDLSEKHYGRPIRIRGSRRKPTVEGILEKAIHHPTHGHYLSGTVAITVDDKTYTVPWYKFVVLGRKL